MHILRYAFALAAMLFSVAPTFAASVPPIAQELDIATVWSAHPVGFDLLTHRDHQFVAYYDANRKMTVAWRRLDSDQWSFKILPSSLGWDSHNYVTLAVDDDGYLHLAGNMHCVPLIYFRTSKPLDPATFVQVPSMVGTQENRCTYPRFFRGPSNELIFTYRDGQSGAGDQIYNVYDHTSRTWRRLLDKPLTDGHGKMNAYLQGPVRGPDGYFHLTWVWRNTPDCATNHTLSYARSKNLTQWETGSGKPLTLPLMLDNADIVDPVPPGGGIINGNTLLGFDSRKRPIISYHKFDNAGKTQLYNARLEDGRWRIYQTSQWGYRWAFAGGGTIHFEIHFSPVTLEPDGILTQSYSHSQHGSATWRLDENTLTPIAQFARPLARPAQLEKPESPFPGMQVRWKADSSEPRTPYWLRWESLDENRDQPRPQPWPSPAMLRLYHFLPDN